MPSSSYQGKHWTVQSVLHVVKHDKSPGVLRLLDIGAGQGTYYDFLDHHFEKCFWTAVEAWAPYVDEFDLENKYDLVINEDVRDLKIEDFDLYHIGFCGDVLEHMEKSEAKRLIRGMRRVCEYIYISLPVIEWPQDAVNGNPFEEHVATWSPEEIPDAFPDAVIDQYVDGAIGCYVLRGLT